MFVKAIVAIWDWKKAARAAAASHWLRGSDVLIVVTWV